jgi:low affinity Fe/Cu permease
MRTFRPDRLVRMMAAVASFAYFAFWIGGILVLVALPAVKALGGSSSNFHYGLELPVATPNMEATVQTTWGPAPLKLDEARAKLQLPIPILPWSLLAVLWIYTAVAFTLILTFLQNLRRIFQRVRDGAAFDAQNAVRLRTLSLLLLALTTVNAVADVATAMAVRRGLETTGSFAVPSGLHADLTLVPVALVLMALAEVFRRGAELEDEQSLVV